MSVRLLGIAYVFKGRVEWSSQPCTVTLESRHGLNEPVYKHWPEYLPRAGCAAAAVQSGLQQICKTNLVNGHQGSPACTQRDRASAPCCGRACMHATCCNAHNVTGPPHQARRGRARSNSTSSNFHIRVHLAPSPPTSQNGSSQFCPGPTHGPDGNESAASWQIHCPAYGAVI